MFKRLKKAGKHSKVVEQSGSSDVKERLTSTLPKSYSQLRNDGFHKVLWIIKELDKMWLLLQKHKSVHQMHQRKIYDEEYLKIDNSEKYTLNKQLFESISKPLNEAET
ncbi:hypothetical protein ES332_A13G136400v1 [Gossypium tomentosum]|uniref:Uncharacterized protein n=1 Tax=Gossypium tomentosum TaxID=34277 RepID=A0A5D2MK05_GOSTO|nr:hypothetical protein ES332_A13G136400v1 [Gossypium tomentosum]